MSRQAEIFANEDDGDKIRVIGGQIEWVWQVGRDNWFLGCDDNVIFFCGIAHTDRIPRRALIAIPISVFAGEDAENQFPLLPLAADFLHKLSFLMYVFRCLSINVLSSQMSLFVSA